MVFLTSCRKHRQSYLTNFLADALQNEAISNWVLIYLTTVIPESCCLRQKPVGPGMTRLNLTRHTDVQQFVERDVTDTAAICPHI